MATYAKKIDGNEIYAKRAEETATGVNIDSALAEKANKVENPQEGHLVGLDAQGELVDVGATLGDYKTKQQPVTDPSASGNETSFIDTISQDENGVISATKKTVPGVNSETAGLMSPADKLKLDGIENNANNYQHPTIYPEGEAPALGLYKVSLNDAGHVAAVAEVVKEDIVDLGIPDTDTTYTASDGITLDDTTFKHTNIVAPGTIGPGQDTFGNTVDIPSIEYDDNGHITQTTTHTHTSFPLPETDGEFVLGVTNDTSDTGSAPGWKEMTKNMVGGGGILLDENDEPLLDENDDPIIDERSMELWTAYDSIGFAAERAVADEEGNNIKDSIGRKIENVFIGDNWVEKSGHDVHIPLAVSEGNVDQKTDGAMSSVDKYKVDAIEFPTTEDPDYLYDDNNSCNKICKVGYPADGGYDGGYEEMLRIGYTARQTGDNVNVWLGSLAGLNDGKVGFYKLVGEITEPSDYRNASNWEPYNIGTVETSNTIDDKMVYLDTVNGSDDNSGLTVDKPVQTVYRAFRVFANEFYYGDGKTARIRVLDDNANVVLDNSYDEDNYEYFDWIAFYGTGNVTFVYDLEADDQGKFVDSIPRNNLWAEFDGNIAVTTSGAYMYKRKVHFESNYGSVTFSGEHDSIDMYQPYDVAQIYAKAYNDIVWTCDWSEQREYTNASVYFLAGRYIIFNKKIGCRMLYASTDYEDRYIPLRPDSGDLNTHAGIHIYGTVTVYYGATFKSDYIELTAPFTTSSDSQETGTVLFSQLHKYRLGSNVEQFMPCLKATAPIYGEYVQINFEDGLVDAIKISNYDDLIIKATVVNFSQPLEPYSNGSDTVINSVQKTYLNGINNGGDVTIHTSLLSNNGTITLGQNRNCYITLAEMNYLSASSLLGTIYAGNLVIDGGNNLIGAGSQIRTTTYCEIKTSNDIELGTVVTPELNLSAKKVTISENIELGKLNIRCDELCVNQPDGSLNPGRVEFLAIVEPTLNNPISTLNLPDTVINIGRITYTSSVTSDSGNCVFWLRKAPINIVANIMECNFIPFRADGPSTDAPAKLNAKINMTNVPILANNGGSPLLGDSSDLHIKIVSDFDTDGTTPGTVSGYDYKYIVISDAVA